MKKQAKKTGWIPGNVKPTIPGWYQRSQGDGSLYWYWCGKEWKAGGWPRPLGGLVCDKPSIFQDYEWRGLASKPEGA